ncbi:MAG TPA: hypothetical protein VKE69_13220, partial [Planctomycetota bacterium]|nr:hypothetical protein [Planctomycetota bacterium]
MSDLPTGPALERLIETIARELLAAGMRPGALDGSAVCACHGCGRSACPQTIEGVLAAGADRVGVESSLPREAAHLAAQIDHTLLKPEATYAQIDTLCAEAREFRFATVCVNPMHVRRCAERLR